MNIELSNSANANAHASLHAQYSDIGGVTQVFGNKAANYALARPGYAPALFAQLMATVNPVASPAVADIGAGTGLLTKGLLACSYVVEAVEPNDAMRAVADAALGADQFYRSVSGTAEATGLNAHSKNLVCAAQAFHWFDVKKARAEFIRILKPYGHVALIWNDRLVGDPLNTGLNGLFSEFGGVRRREMVNQDERAGVPDFFGQKIPEQRFAHTHFLSTEALRALVFSRSYMPAPESAEGIAAIAAIDAVFYQHAIDNRVAMRYETVLCLGRFA
jgi:SAM-dependent methyltransferase